MANLVSPGLTSLHLDADETFSLIACGKGRAVWEFGEVNAAAEVDEFNTRTECALRNQVRAKTIIRLTSIFTCYRVLWEFIYGSGFTLTSQTISSVLEHTKVAENSEILMVTVIAYQ